MQVRGSLCYFFRKAMEVVRARVCREADTTTSKFLVKHAATTINNKKGRSPACRIPSLRHPLLDGAASKSPLSKDGALIVWGRRLVHLR